MFGPAKFCRSIAALAFDVDGTLADTDPIHAKAWLSALWSVNGREFDVEDYIERCILGAMSPREFLSQYCTEDEWPLVEAKKREVYPEYLADGVALLHGVTSLVSAAQSAGIRIALVSSSSRESVEALLNQFWDNRLPDVVICRSDVATSKPHADPYRMAIARLGIASADVIAFEDSDAGMRAAKAAGLACIQVGTGSSELADFRIDDFGECHIETRNGRVCLTI
ncbi:HAD family phosphatase [Nocardia sp. NPDC052112]|uniref:HAD family hydrolase n=1 Tax=Nocardia sp. NPDC052112 TaxID=3155646 RepID=UPI00343A75BC